MQKDRFVELQNKINSFPKVKLLWGTTPIVRAGNISEKNNVEVYVKRDDLTGLALGGNKTRKLEFLLGEAVIKGYDTLITAGAVHSNHALQTAAAGKKMGLDVILVLRGREELKGNLLMDRLLDADVRIFDVPTSRQLGEHMKSIAADLQRRGKKPMIIPVGGSSPTGALGYVNAALEIVRQCYERDLKFDYVISPTSSGGTQSGLLLAYKLISPNTKVLGIGVGDPREEVSDEVENLVRWISLLLGIYEDTVTRRDIESSIIDGYGFGGYGTIDTDIIRLIKNVAKDEGFYLDPVYSGKAFYGLMDMINNNSIPQGAKVLFVHTGGLGGIFQYEDIIAQCLSEQQ